MVLKRPRNRLKPGSNALKTREIDPFFRAFGLLFHVSHSGTKSWHYVIRMSQPTPVPVRTWGRFCPSTAAKKSIKHGQFCSYGNGPFPMKNRNVVQSNTSMFPWPDVSQHRRTPSPGDYTDPDAAGVADMPAITREVFRYYLNDALPDTELVAVEKRFANRPTCAMLSDVLEQEDISKRSECVRKGPSCSRRFRPRR